ncbi:GntR family transcriptional regulator [Streptomyces cavourensis]|jgi:DNA-binding GntR family transcriptional regulator|uniref:GntR family transcriptional regulator n=1 Tax=unclassified Achromobacter TaxID=2626865 RepID=UPI000E07D13C|nr:GntR family transcriptional regulator [Streptomyces cavourensis]
MPETPAALTAFESVNVPDLVGVVEDRLTQAIVQGRLPPGSRVVEAEIARQMAISRAPVREASRRLERQGILVSKPRRGFFVREMSVREIDDLFQVRLSLEMTAVAAACEHADAAGLARLTQLLQLMIAEAADAPQHRRIELDLSFHTLICELSGNAYLLRLFSSTQTEMRMIISLIDNVYQDPELVASTHQPILDALARRDVQAAQACMKVHLDDAWEHVRNLFVSQHGAAGEKPRGSKKP